MGPRLIDNEPQAHTTHTATWLCALLTPSIFVRMVIVDPKITAKTERLHLRPLAIEDAAEISRSMFSNPEVMKHT